MVNDLGDLFAEPLHDLGEDDPSLRGIVTPRSERGAAKRGVTAQFLENAAEYHQRYANVEYFRFLIDRALATFKPPIEPRVILDIGSGSGNSVIPMLDRFRDAFVVATDISPQLLAILRDHLVSRPEYRDRFALVCMDASNDHYRTGGFDLAVGAAILHHIIEPERVIRACERALRPGGVAIFFEPFEVGHALLGLAYREIIAEADRRREGSRGIAMLRRLTADYAVRMRDKSDPIFLQLDDKWMFSRGFFESLAHGGDWAECRVYPINGDASPLTDQTRINLRLGIGADESALPAWAWDTLSQYESVFSQQARRDLIFEGAVVLRRGEFAVRHDPEEDGPGSGWWWNPAEAGRGFFVEIRDGLACIACFVYDDDGRPTWHAAGPALFATSGEMTARSRLLRFPVSAGNVASRPGEEAEAAFSIRFDGPRKARLSWAATRVALEPQHAENPGFAGLASRSLSGWWVEDTERPAWATVVECLDDRVIAALLSESEWCLTVAFRRNARSYAGEWLRFCGGQTISGPYRSPTSPQSIGEARLVWTDTNCLVVKLPNGRQRALTRLGFV